MKTNTLNRILSHNFFLYGIVFLSVLQLVNFYNAQSLTCLGAFGVVYYVACMYVKNKAICLLIANIVSIFILGCEKTALFEGMGHGDKCDGLDQGVCETTDGCMYGLKNDDDTEPSCYSTE